MLLKMEAKKASFSMLPDWHLQSEMERLF